jgi:hypothetical protein
LGAEERQVKTDQNTCSRKHDTGDEDPFHGWRTLSGRISTAFRISENACVTQARLFS